jgi:SAM-dependent methyltransferase
MKRIYIVFKALFFDPLKLVMKIKALPVFLKNIMTYQSTSTEKSIKINWGRLRYYTYERYLSAGSVGGHYFLQDVWAAKKLFDDGCKFHVDIGSRIDGFIAHLLPFCTVEYVDIRPMKSPFPALIFKEGSILELPYETGSVASLSCLHVIEHIGLGRYGDPIDPEGHIKAARELCRVLKPGGKLLIGTPVGQQSLFFDAHRVFYVETVLKIFEELTLQSFAFIDDVADQIITEKDFSRANSCRFGCGLFEFTKS